MIVFYALYKEMSMFRKGVFFLLPIFSFMVSGSILSAEKSTKDYIKDLQSSDPKTVIAAAHYLGKEEEKEAIDPLIAVAKNNSNTQVRVAAIAALGQMDEKGKPTTELKNIIVSDKNNTVVYAALLAILNLKDFDNKAAKEAIDYCDKNKSDDPFIKDAVQKIKKLMK